MTPEIPATAGRVASHDGRRQRSQRSRDGVISAILDLVCEGNERPTTAEIADRAGVSVRSVFRHFDDVESLYAEALTVHMERVAELYDLPPLPEARRARIEVLVTQRTRLYATTAPVRRSAERLRLRSPAIAEGLDSSRRLLREQLEAVFAPELQHRAHPERTQLVDALEVALSWYGWDAQVRVYGHDGDRAAATMARTVEALLA